MEVEHVSRLGFSGNTLNVEERAGLEVAMMKRAEEEGGGRLLFWGKVSGTRGSYLVCCGLRQEAEVQVPVKKLYYCTLADFELKEFPELTAAERELAAKHAAERFEGDPQKEVATYESKQAEGEDGEAEEAVFREYQRLGHAVVEIDAAVSTVPRGAYVVDASGRVLANPSFRGLDPVHAGDLDSFQHFRASAKPHRAVEAEKRDAGSTDFLDPLSEDVPKGAWSLQFSPNKTAVTLRSLQWPGYFFFHRVGTPDFGGAYFGDGRKNVDLSFML